jgi:putative isomerase
MIIQKFLLAAAVFLLICSCRNSPNNEIYTGEEYPGLKKELASGWNTWNTRSVMSHILLPDKLALNIYAKDNKSGRILKEAFIGNKVQGSEKAIPGDHAYDGSYTDLRIFFEDLSFRIQTCASGDDISILVTPIADKSNDGYIMLAPDIIWDGKGDIREQGDHLMVNLPDKEISIRATTIASPVKLNEQDEVQWAFPLDKTVGFTTLGDLSVADISLDISEAAGKFNDHKSSFGEAADIYEAAQTVMAWNTIYDPTKDRVITPVSRIWNYGWNGYVLFCWDNYFVSYMFSIDNKELAYANAIEITNEVTESGFVPNFAATSDLKSRDRSQPLVGSMMVREIYRKYQEKWFLHEVFDKLLTWNRWWPENRDTDGLLCWGSNPYDPVFNHPTEEVQNVLQGAKYESGLDNSPMYDDASFDSVTHQMRLADAGLNGLYIADCKALAEIADVLGKDKEEKELKNRASFYSKNLQQLWSEEKGIFLNMHTDTKKSSNRISPANFYPLIGKAASQKQAERMITGHFYNPDEFWGDWIIPSISRNDPAYHDNDYWRGRIWAPMNFLVYLGLRNYDLPEARKDLAEKSKNLLMKGWDSKRFINENYNADTGEGADVPSSDNFYHWGALLGVIYLIEEGILPAPEEPLKK